MNKLFQLMLLFAIAGIISISVYYLTDISQLKNNSSDKGPPSESGLSEYDRLQKELADLEREELFWKNRIKLAKNDQFNLIFNFPDSLLELEIQGISVQQSKIESYELCPEINRILDILGPVKWLVKPVNLNEQWATIPKQPIRIKDITNMKNLSDSLSFIPISKDTGDVVIVLVCSENLSIAISQIKKPDVDNPYLKRDLNETSIDIIRSVADSLQFSDLLQKDWISLKIPRLEAISIYRAITDESQAIIRL